MIQLPQNSETNNRGRSAGRGKRSAHLQKDQQKTVQEANNEPLDPEFEVVTGISFSFEPKLFPDRSLLGNAGSFSTLDAKKKVAELGGDQKVAEMMTALYKQGMFGNVGVIQERIDGIKGLEKNFGKALGEPIINIKFHFNCIYICILIKSNNFIDKFL